MDGGSNARRESPRRWADRMLAINRSGAGCTSSSPLNGSAGGSTSCSAAVGRTGGSSARIHEGEPYLTYPRLAVAKGRPHSHAGSPQRRVDPRAAVQLITEGRPRARRQKTGVEDCQRGESRNQWPPGRPHARPRISAGEDRSHTRSQIALRTAALILGRGSQGG